MKKKQRKFRVSPEKPLEIGMRGIVAYCDMSHGKWCDKCMINGFHKLTYVNLICRPVEDYPQEYVDIEQEYMKIKEKEKK